MDSPSTLAPGASAGERKKPKVRKMLKKRGAYPNDSPGVRPGVGCILIPVILRDAVLARFHGCRASSM